MKKNKTIIVVIVAIIGLIVGAIVFSKGTTKNNLQESNENIADVDENNEENSNSQNSNNDENTSSGDKILIAVFSRAGENYAVGNVEVGNTEVKDNNERPEIKNKVQNFDEYDTIFLGYPIWYGSYPMIINTFLESYDFSGKTIIPFNTHGGSGSSGTYEEIRRKMNNCTIKDGLAISGSDIRDSRAQVENWLRGLEF